MFHQTHGFYVHGMPIESAIMPHGWQQRTTPISDPISGKTGFCIEIHDLAASKIVAYREKDREFVRLLLIEKLIDSKILAERIDALKIEEKWREHLLRWVDITVKELDPHL